MFFRQTREMLLLTYDSKIISDEELLVLWESCRSKNPDFPHSSYARFDLKNIDETECLAYFRVQKQSIPVLANVLQLPMNIRCQQRTICDRIELIELHATEKVFLSMPLFRYNRPIWKTSSRVMHDYEGSHG